MTKAKKKNLPYQFLNNRRFWKWASISLLGIFFIFLIWLWLQNPAKRAEKPLESALSNLHPSMICENGDGRFEIDGGSPHYTAYFNIDITGNSTQEILSIAQKYGYNLKVDEQRISSIINKGSDTLPGETYHEYYNEYFTGSNSTNKLNLAIMEAGPEPLSCGTTATSTTAYPLHSPQPYRAILQLELVSK